MKNFCEEIVQEIRWGDFNKKYGMNLDYRQQIAILRFINFILIPKMEEKHKISNENTKRR